MDPELAASLAGVSCQRRAVLGPESDALLSCPDVEPEPWASDENATATINYTSGTMARPKGVQVTHRNLWIHATILGLHPRFGPKNWGVPASPRLACSCRWIRISSFPTPASPGSGRSRRGPRRAVLQKPKTVPPAAGQSRHSAAPAAGATASPRAPPSNHDR